ncbi:MAG: hypothetical protein ABI983_04115 [Acidobacteriota bacterium]
MRLLPRLAVALAVFALSDAHSAAQFRRGMMGETVEINLFPAIPPSLLLPAGSFQVEVKNQSTGPSRILSRMDEAITKQLSENDSRLRVAEGKPELQVVATLTEWTLSRRHGTRYVSEQRQIGTKQVKDSKGNYKTEPVYEYGHNKPTTIDDGAAAVHLEVRRGTQVLADETTRFTYHEDRLVDEGPPSTSDVEDTMIDRTAQRAAGLVTPSREPVKVLLARSDEVDKLNDLARSRKWNEWRAALQETRPHRDPKKDAYRLHNIAVANEALSYEAANDDEALRLIQEAATMMQQAIAAKKDEKYFDEAFSRVSKNSLALTRLKTMRAALGLRQTTAAAKPAATAPAEKVKLAPKSPTTTGPMTNADVIELRKAGLDDDNLIAAIKEAGATKFDLTPTGLKTLLTAKITNRVITVMRERK